MRDLLARSKTGISGRFRDSKSLSGQQILESLLAIANEADKQFTPEMLQDFWKPNIIEGVYLKFIRDIAAGFGLNEMPLYEPVEPISGYNRHHSIPKREIGRLLPYLKITDREALERTKEDDELLLVSYHIWYVTCSSRHYFHAGDVSPLHELYLRMRGIREIKEVEEEVVNILKPHQMNKSAVPLEIVASLPRDLFEYKERLFTLGRKRGDVAHNDGRWVDVIWAFGVYTRWPKPIGYVLFKEISKEEKYTPQHRKTVSSVHYY